MAKKQYLDLAGLEVYDEQIKAHIASIAEDSVYYITATPNDDLTSGTVDKSMAQLEEAYNEGKVLICKVAIDGGHLMLPLCGEAFSNDVALFGAFLNNSYILVTITANSVVVNFMELAQADQIPTNTSQLTNNSGFITDSVSNLTNYYTKTQVDTKDNAALASAKEYTDTVSQNALVTVQQLDESVLADAKAYAVDLALAAGEDAKSWIATAKEEVCAYTDTAVSGKADKDHTHDDRYYTETEVNNLLAGKANSSHGTHVSYSTTAPVMDGTASAGSASTVARSDHKHPTDTSRASQASLDSHTGNTTVHITSTERTNWNAAKTHADSAHAPSNAQPNQNAFSNVTVGSTTIAADTTTDTLTMEAGTGISVSADVTNDKVTITNSGVRSITTGSSNGTISVNTNGTSADVAVTGLGSAAYTASTAYDAAGSADTALASAKTYTDGKIDAIVGEGASETLDTIGEISAAITENQGMLETLNDAIGSKSAKTHTHTVSHTPAGDISETSITPAGTVSQPTFTGTAASHNHSFTGTEVTLNTDFTPAGSVSSTFTGTAASHDHSFTGTAVTSGAPSGTATVASSTHTHKYTPAGTVSQPTFTGSAVTSGASSGTTSVYSITGVGSVPSLTASVANRCLTLTFSAGSVPTRSSVTLPSTSHTHSVTAAGTVSKPTFSGTEASTTSISGTATVAKSDHTHSVTAAGTVGGKSVTPAGTISSTFTGSEGEIAIDYTPAGTVGNKSITPAGTVSQPTFTGTTAKHKHTFTGTAATLTTNAANN